MFVKKIQMMYSTKHNKKLGIERLYTNLTHTQIERIYTNWTHIHKFNAYTQIERKYTNWRHIHKLNAYTQI